MNDIEKTYNFVMRVLKLASDWHINGPDSDLWWKCYGEYAPITFFIRCDDVFFWGSSDCEKITEDNIDSLEQALKDAKAVDEKFGFIYGTMLCCSRMRKMRPQGAAYPDDEKLWPLFDACGPEREVGFGNPYKPGEYGKK